MFNKLLWLKLWKAIHANGDIIIKILKKSPNLQDLTIDKAVIWNKTLDWILKYNCNLSRLVLWRWRGYESKGFVATLIEFESNQNLYGQWILNNINGVIIFSESNVFKKYDKPFISQHFRLPWIIRWEKEIQN